MRIPRLLLAAAVSLGLGACAGELSNPDTTTGEVVGSVANAAGGYVYVLGSPQVTAAVRADGSFSLGRVPVGDQRLVLVAGYQGGGTSVTKALLVPVAVEGGMRARLGTRDASVMPAAGRVVAAVRPPAGAVAQGATFTVLKTNQFDIPGPMGGQVLVDLPAGTWDVTARLAGYREPTPVAVAVPPGASAQIEFGLEVKVEDAQRGCLANGCENGLQCSGSDGRCYPCLADDHCGAGDTCDTVTHTCIEGTNASGALCEASDSPLKCPNGMWVQTQASPQLGYCTRACPGGADTECPAGWACSAGLCVAGPPEKGHTLQACAALRAAFGSPCAIDATCHEALARDACVRGDEDHPGYCSAACTTTQDCADAGLDTAWTCRPLPERDSTSQGYCRRDGD